MSANPQDIVEEQDFRAKIHAGLMTLKPREELALRLRFGMGCEEHTLKEVGEVLSVCTERARQIVAKSLRRLKHPNKNLARLLPDDEWERIHSARVQWHSDHVLAIKRAEKRKAENILRYQKLVEESRYRKKQIILRRERLIAEYKASGEAYPPGTRREDVQ